MLVTDDHADQCHKLQILARGTSSPFASRGKKKSKWHPPTLLSIYIQFQNAATQTFMMLGIV